MLEVTVEVMTTEMTAIENWQTAKSGEGKVEKTCGYKNGMKTVAE